jgi:glutathione S-transferase
MKLFISPTSVFVRKVRVVAREKGLSARIEEIATVPVESAPELTAVNPLSQIPALIDDEGVVWNDSNLIAAWLDHIGSGPKLLPEYGSEAFWGVRRIEVAASGLNEMLAKIVYEGRRPENEQSPFWLERWENNLVRGFEQANTICPEADVFDMSAISLTLAASFCDFRLSRVDWRKLAPKIAALHEVLEKRPSFIDTYPK